MTLEQFVEKLRAILANPNGLAVEGTTIYVFSDDSELVAFGVEKVPHFAC